MNLVLLAGLLANSALSPSHLVRQWPWLTKQIMSLQQRELLRIHTGFPINSLTGNQYGAKVGIYLRDHSYFLRHA